ncbi:MAG: PAS domain-containing protein [Alphaproteobacteria bacterium]|nr:PAS domain-containing protein [Alphaproteobacteria bacterium]
MDEGRVTLSDSSTSSVAKSQEAAAKGAIWKMVLTGFVLIGLAGAGVFFTFQFAENERERELKQWQIRLGIVADSRFADIDSWLDGQLGELTALAENGSLQIYTGILIEAEDRDMPSLEADSLNSLLAAVAERAGFKAEVKGSEIQANVERVGVAGIGILDRDGNSLVSSPGMPPNEGQLKAFVAGVEKGERGVSDMFLNAAGNPAMAFLVPIFSVQGDQDASSQIGTIVGVKEITNELYPLLKQPGNVDKTAEALIVRRKGTSVEYLTPRADGTAPLKKGLSMETPNLAAAFALNTPGGFGIRTDYQDHEVLLTVRGFNQVPWSLIYKIDTSESLAEAENRIRTIVLAFIGIIVLVFIGLIAVWYYGSSRRATEAATRFEALSERFQGQRNFMHLVTDSQLNSIVVFDEGGHYRWFNQVALKLSGLDRRDLFDKHIAAVLGPLEGKRVETWIKECLAKFEPTSYTHELTFDGREMRFSNRILFHSKRARRCRRAS